MKKSEQNVKINTILGKESVVEGDFKAEGSTRIDGTVNGNVTVKGILILGSCGNIQGDVKAQAAIVGGVINGNVIVDEKIEASSTARIIGDITTSVLVIDEKAVFQGGCNMNQEVSKVKKPSSRDASKAGKAGRKSAKEAIEAALKDVDAEMVEEENKEAEQTEKVTE